MKNAFERRGINHLSPSSLNLWRASPGLWAARYLAGLSEDGPAMWRGSAVEAGLARFLRSGDLAEAQIDAQRTSDHRSPRPGGGPATPPYRNPVLPETTSLSQRLLQGTCPG